MKPTPARKPRVLVPGCNRMVGDHAFHVAGKKYVDAVRLAGCLPLIVPSATPDELDELLDQADGVLLTGSPSNVHPSHFGEEIHDPSLPLDPERDAWTLPIIRKVLARGMPLFAICRGFQEANVALGGALHQAVQEQPGLHDHREPAGLSVDEQYADTHEVDVMPGGLLQELLRRDSFKVNSLHGQGIKRLAPGLRVEAQASDGLVEAFGVEKNIGTGFALCVQWHPEWKAAENPVSMTLLQAFGQACADYRDTVPQVRHDSVRDPET